MKFKKLLIIFLTILLGYTIINYFFQNSDELDRFAIIDLDVNDLEENGMDTFITESEYFDLLTAIQIKNDNNNDSIEFSVQMDNPSTVLKDVEITVLLNESLEKTLLTDQFFVSNIPHYTTLEPNGTSKGLSVAKLIFPLPEDHLLKEDFSENEIVDLLTDIKMKISWKDQSGIEVIQYIKPEQNSIQINPKVINLLVDF